MNLARTQKGLTLTVAAVVGMQADQLDGVLEAVPCTGAIDLVLKRCE